MEVIVRVPAGAERVSVVGSSERNLKLIREALDVHVSARDGRVHISGHARAVGVARAVLDSLVDAAQQRRAVTRQQVLDLISEESAAAEKTRRGWKSEEVEAVATDDDWGDRLNVFVAGKPVRPLSANQEAYLGAIRRFDLVFGVGPAGTGKTYLAVAAAVHLLRMGRVKRVVLTRPAVEAGERLGFLPGDLREKVNPYLRPLFDALHDMMDFATVRRFMENDVVEVCPLAFMRGRTLNQSVVILDEAQNCTKGQMKMFLTRMGQGSKLIVTGDPTQSDLEDGSPSGLVDALTRLRRTEGVGFVGFEPVDVIRHDLVKRVIDAYGDDPPTPTRENPKGRNRRAVPEPQERVSSPDNSQPDPA